MRAEGREAQVRFPSGDDLYPVNKSSAFFCNPVQGIAEVLHFSQWLATARHALQINSKHVNY
jgi:hypothetical protein